MTTTCGKLRVQAYYVYERDRRDFGINIIAHTMSEAKAWYAESAGVPLYELNARLSVSGAAPVYNPGGY